jgi:serine/threonine-protein kinase
LLGIIVAVPGGVSDAAIFHPGAPAALGRPPTWFGVYRAVERIGEGGMGVIFRAEDGRDGRSVAIKIARSAREADTTAIRREIITLSGLRHPGIVRLHGYGVQSGGPWIALELLEGRTLADALSSFWPETRGYGERRQRTDERPTAPARNLRDRVGTGASRLFPIAAGGRLADTLAIVQQLCLALDHLHRRRLVHRDVKPANVFLRGDGRTTLFDFGLACAAGATRDRALCVGTVEYAAPEQIRGAAVDRRADIYSLGCLLYELVTGRPPFQGDSSSEIAERQMRREPAAPSDVIADVPSRLDDLILSMLEKLPEHRPEDAAEIERRIGEIARRAQQASGVVPIRGALFQEVRLRHAG